MTDTHDDLSSLLIAKRYTVSSVMRFMFVFLTQLTAIVYFMFVISILALDEVAILGKASIILTLSTSLSTLGLFYYANRVIPQLLNQKKEFEAYFLSKKLIFEGTFLGLIISLMISLIGYFTLKIPILYFSLTLIAVILLTVFIFLNSLNVSWLKLEGFIFFGSIRTLITYGLIIVLFLYFNSFLMVFIGWILAVILIMPFLLYSHPLVKLSKRHTEAKGGLVKTLTIFEMAVYGFPYYLNNALFMVNLWFDKVFTAIFFVSSAFAVYFVMSRIAEFVGDAFLSLRGGILSVLSFFYGDSEEKTIRAFKVLFDVFIYIFLGLTLLLSSYSDIITLILLGEKYYSGAVILSILFIAIFFRAIYLLIQGLPSAYKAIKPLPIITLITIFTRFTSYIILLEYEGIGIAFANVISELVGLVALLLWFRKMFRFNKVPIIKTVLLSVLIYIISLFRIGVTWLDALFGVLYMLCYFVLGSYIRILSPKEVDYLIKMKVPMLSKFVYYLARIGRYRVSIN